MRVGGRVQSLPGKGDMCWAGTQNVPVTARDMVRKQTHRVSIRAFRKGLRGSLSDQVVALASGYEVASWVYKSQGLGGIMTSPVIPCLQE